MSERLLYSIEAEQSVIGALLLDGKAYDRIADRVKASDFHVEAHRLMYAELAAQFAAGREPDVATLISGLQSRGNLERAGGNAYLEKILMAVPSASNIAHYAKIVVDHRMERDLVNVAADIRGYAELGGPIEQRMDQAQQALFSLTESSTTDEPVEISDALVEWVDALEKRVNSPGELAGLSTGLRDLDEKTSGLQDGDLIIIGARPSMGKTSLAMTFARRTIVDDKTALVFSMEMGRDQLTQLSVSAFGRVDNAKLRNGQLTSDDWDRISAGIGRMHLKKLLIDDSSSLTVTQIAARARRVKRKHGLHLIVVDYLQLMSTSAERRDLGLSEITRGLKQLAKDLNVPVVLLSQLNRDVEKRPNKRPMMADLRDSGGIEADADVIIFVYRDEIYNEDSPDKGTAELIIGKQRMGVRDTVRSAFLGEFSSFENLERGWVSSRAENAAPATRKIFDDKRRKRNQWDG